MEFPTESLLVPLRILARGFWHWFPIVAVFATISELPEVAIHFYLPEALGMMTSLTQLGSQGLIAGLLAMLLLACLQFLFMLIAQMFAFVIVADLTAGRTPNLWEGMKRLASWRLQFVWLLAGLFEQASISLWYMGAGALMVPAGLVTTASYEEKTGFDAFSRSYEMGMNEQNGSRPGVRIAIGVTLAFLISFLVSGVFSLASLASEGPNLLKLMEGGLLDSRMLEGNFDMFQYSWFSAVKDMLLAPFGQFSTVYMMALQQSVYWETRRFMEKTASPS